MNWVGLEVKKKKNLKAVESRENRNRIKNLLKSITLVVMFTVQCLRNGPNNLGVYLNLVMGSISLVMTLL